jgi:hypothetical protein
MLQSGAFVKPEIKFCPVTSEASQKPTIHTPNMTAVKTYLLIDIFGRLIEVLKKKNPLKAFYAETGKYTLRLTQRS